MYAIIRVRKVQGSSKVRLSKIRMGGWAIFLGGLGTVGENRESGVSLLTHSPTVYSILLFPALSIKTGR